MLFVMAMMTIRAIPQRTSQLEQSINMNENERCNRQRDRGGNPTRRRASNMLPAPVRDQFKKLAKRDQPQDIAEQNEEEHRPEERHEPIGVFLQGRTKDFDTQEFEDRFKEV